MPRAPPNIDDLDWNVLNKFLDRSKPVMDQMGRQARAPDAPTNLPLQKRVEHRCQLGRIGQQMAALSCSSIMDAGPAVHQGPAKENSMLHCVEQLYKIVVQDYGRVQNPQFHRVLPLLRRVRHLLRVYYDWKVTRKPHPDLTHCDWKNVFDVGLKLHEVALYIQLDPPRFRAIMEAIGPELETFVLYDPIDVGQWRVAAQHVDNMVSKYEEADDDDRFQAGDITDKASEDLAAHVMSWFLADMLVTFILNDPTGSSNRANKAMKRIVGWSTSHVMRDVLGDPLTDSMRPLYWSKPALIKLGQAGGLAALFGDWVNSTCKDLAEEILESLPDPAWENQTTHSLACIAKEIQYKIQHESSDIVLNPAIVNAMYQIHKRHGIAPFTAAGKRETPNDPILFYYVQHRIKADNLELNTKAKWRVLLRDYVNLPGAIENRYSWSNYNVSSKWDCLEMYGCANPDCPEKKELLKLRDRRVKGVRVKEVEDRLERWGSKAKPCSACLDKAYCTPECQKAHWKAHKPECLKARNKPKRA